MCIVIDVDGTEIIAPDEVALDSNNIRRTVKFLEAEKQIYAADRKRKKETREARKRQSKGWKEMIMRFLC